MELATYWVNGLPQEEITLQDRAIQYGDGFFTTILVVNKQILNWASHWERIKNSSQVLGLPLIKLEQLSNWLEIALNDYFEKNDTKDCVLKIIITRGTGGVGYQMPETIGSNCLFYIKPSPIQLNQGELTAIQPMEIGLCKTLASMGSLAGVKSLNRLENVMARTEMAENGYQEGLMLNALNYVVCGTQSNIYLLKDGTVFTPKIKESGVAGTTRFQMNTLVQKLGWKMEEKNILLTQIEQADELFLTNAVRGVQPVKQFLNAQYTTVKTEQIHQAWSTWQMENATSVNSFKSMK
ncbi:aminodeoxychorismate lyase [Thiomicrorhabdus sp. Kp2]|uniref:aminodeoxychorismate lyase n=1 Tax=Thiomicrorhabdus sp. Kp2 TaxID=1123518 RepID=UPI0003FE4D21|nr:aminodeoxychorismate lyase [Thiomicrorhabdus sp. Kp2]